jgi:hypothetical protein
MAYFKGESLMKREKVEPIYRTEEEVLAEMKKSHEETVRVIERNEVRLAEIRNRNKPAPLVR